MNLNIAHSSDTFFHFFSLSWTVFCLCVTNMGIDTQSLCLTGSCTQCRWQMTSLPCLKEKNKAARSIKDTRFKTRQLWIPENQLLCCQKILIRNLKQNQTWNKTHQIPNQALCPTPPRSWGSSECQDTRLWSKFGSKSYSSEDKLKVLQSHLHRFYVTVLSRVWEEGCVLGPNLLFQFDSVS